MTGLAASPDAVEVLVAADPDDEATQEAAGAAANVACLVMPQRFGYAGLHLYYNALAAAASGQWLLLWNDDATMLTSGWDKVLGGEEPGILWTQSNHGPYNFPALPRAWAEAWGHVSLSPNVDVWAGDIGRRLGLGRVIPVEVFHDRKDITGGHDDQTYAEGRAVMGAYSNHPDYDSPANREARVRDAVAIRRLLG